ncbi:hypothetical protein ACFSTD_12480 [Novosphingobium colocasiae]
MSDEAKHIYSSRMVYLSDPFAKCGKATNEFIRWEAPHLGPMMQEAADYRGGSSPITTSTWWVHGAGA